MRKRGLGKNKREDVLPADFTREAYALEIEGYFLDSF